MSTFCTRCDSNERLTAHDFADLGLCEACYWRAVNSTGRKSKA